MIKIRAAMEEKRRLFLKKKKKTIQNKRIFRHEIIMPQLLKQMMEKYSEDYFMIVNIFEDQMDILEETQSKEGRRNKSRSSYRWTKIRKGARYNY